MRHRLQASAFILTLIWTLPCLAEETASPFPEGYHATASDKASSIRELCEATAENGLFSGAVLIAQQGQVLYQEAFGLANREWEIPNTTDTRFRLASVSKQFCSMLIMQLVEEGRLALDDTISKHLLFYREDNGNQITIHHLMAHQSGIPDFTTNYEYRRSISKLPFNPDEFIRQYCSGDLQHDPGTIYSYCNAGYIILGRIIEKVTRRTFEQNLEDRIFVPLGMTASGYDQNEKVVPKRASGYTRGPFDYKNAAYLDMGSSPGAAGALYSTVGDLFLWDQALCTDQLLGAKSRELLFTPNRSVPEVKAAGGRAQSRYGYGWNIDQRVHPVTKHKTKVISHGGAINGFRAKIYRLLDDKAFIVILCNQGDPPGEAMVWNSVLGLGRELTHILTNQPYKMPPPPRLTQEQRLYRLLEREGIDATIEWFRDNGKKATWGGTTVSLADYLIEQGRSEEALQFLEMEMALTPGKVWLIRKAATVSLHAGDPQRAVELARKGLVLKPEDERLLELVMEAKNELERNKSTLE
ncbi:MAG: serine hydrolase [Verrucomicrobiota bacterium]